VEEKPFKELNTPNFLVNNQLSPEIFKVEYAAGLSKGTFEDEDGVKQNKFQQNTFTVMGYPVGIIQRRHQQLYLGFGYSQDRFTSFESETGKSIFEETREAVNLNLFLNTRIKNRLYWFSYLQGGVNGTEAFKDVDNTFNVIALNKVNFKVKRNLNVGLGVGYISNLGDPIIIPAVGVTYSTDKYVLNIDFPVKAEIEGLLAHGKWRPVAGVSFPASSYYLRSANTYVSTQSTQAYVGMRYRVFDLLYLYAAYQTNLGNTYKMGTRDDRDDIGQLNSGSRIVVSLNMQVSKFIPYVREAK